MAARTGIDRATISKLENGRLANPTIGTLRTYAKALGRELAWRLESVRRLVGPRAPGQRAEGTNRGSDSPEGPNPLIRQSRVGNHRRVIMNSPRYSLEEVGTRVASLVGRRVLSLTGRSSHRIVRVDPAKMEYEIEYSSGNRVLVRLNDLYALYREVYARGSIDGSYLSNNVESILGWKKWHLPGSCVTRNPSTGRRLDSRRWGGALHQHPTSNSIRHDQLSITTHDN